MFDLGWQELLVIALVTIIVISPKELPQAIRAVTQFARQVRGLSREFRSGVSELVREAELDELKRQLEKTGHLDDPDDPVLGIDPKSRLTEDFDPRQLAEELKRRVDPDTPSPASAGERPKKMDVYPAGVKAANPREHLDKNKE